MTAAGGGVVVHQSEALGLVLADRNTVAIAPVDISLSFGAYPADCRAVVRFLHPLSNFALISYDPRDLPEEVCFARAPCRGFLTSYPTLLGSLSSDLCQKPCQARHNLLNSFKVPLFWRWCIKFKAK